MQTQKGTCDSGFVLEAIIAKSCTKPDVSLLLLGQDRPHAIGNYTRASLLKNIKRTG